MYAKRRVRHCCQDNYRNTMANINDYIYEEVLEEELKLNKISNKLGKIILKAYNTVNKLEDDEKYDEPIQVMKRMRLEILNLEKKFYNKEVDADSLKTHISAYCKGLLKVKDMLSECEDKKMSRVLEKIDDLVKNLKKIKAVL